MKSANIIKAIEDNFAKEMKDQELQRRYNGFKVELEEIVREEAKLTPIVDNLHHSLCQRSDVIITMVLDDVEVPKKAAEILRDLSSRFNSENDKLSALKRKEEELEDGIEGLERQTKNKIYQHWQVLTAIGHTEMPYMQFSAQSKFDGKIF